MADVNAPLVQCPYVPVHMLRPGTRLQLHLEKCRRNTLNDPRSPFYAKALEIDICKFDSTHHVPRSQMENHLKTCKATLLVEQFRQVDTEVPNFRKLLDSAPQQQPLATPNHFEDENWDDDEPAAPYIPIEKINSNPTLLFNPQGRTKSQKRQFRQERRLLVNGASDALDSSSGSSTPSMVTPEPPKEKPKEEALPQRPIQAGMKPMGRGRGFVTRGPPPCLK